MNDAPAWGAMGPLLAEFLATVDIAEEGDSDPFERARRLAAHRPELLADRRRELAADLRDGDDGDRRRAGRWLCALADAVPSAIAPAEGVVVDALDEPAAHPWCHGILSRLADEPVAGEQAREQALQADDPELRRLAAHSCGRREGQLSETEVDALIELVTDHRETVETRSYAARGLYRRERHGGIYRPRPAAVVPALLELADGSHPVGRRVAPALLVRVALGDPGGHNDRTVTAVADAVDAALRDEDHRVRLRAAAALADSSVGDDDRMVAAVERFEAALAAATADDHPVIAERAEDAYDRLSYRHDLPERPSNRSTADPEADLAEQVGTLADGDPADLAANAALLVSALKERETESETTAALATLADREPARLVEVEAVTALVETVEDERHGSRDAARALLGVVREYPDAVPERAVEAAIARLAGAPGHEPEGALWLPLGIALDGSASLPALLDRAELDAVAAVGALDDDDPRLAGTLGTVLRERLQGLDPMTETADETARGLARLADVAPAMLEGDPGPTAVVRALGRLDVDEREAALADLGAVAADRPAVMAAAAEALLELALDPERAVRATAADVLARVGRSPAGVEALPADGATRDAVAALADAPIEPDRRPPAWPAGLLARADPERVRAAVVRAVEATLAESRGRRRDGEALAGLLQEVHAGDPSVGRPALESLLASLAPESPLPGAEPTVRPDALAALAGLADRYPRAVVEHVEELTGVALSGWSSSERPTGNAATVLGDLIDEGHEDAVYAAIREELTLDPLSKRDGNDREGYLRRHRKLVSEHERVGELYFQALLHETGIGLQRYRDAIQHAVTAFDVGAGELAGADDENVAVFVEGLAAAEFRTAARAFDGSLPSGTVSSIAELLVTADERVRQPAAAADRLAELAARRPEAVADRTDDLVALLDDYRGLTRLIGARVLDVLVRETPTAALGAVVPLAERLVEDGEPAVVRHAASALAAVAAEHPAVVRAAIGDRLDDTLVEADTPADAFRGDEDTRAAVRSVLDSVGIEVPDEPDADERADADSTAWATEEADPAADTTGDAATEASNEASGPPVSPGEGIQFAQAVLEGLEGRTVVLTGAFGLGTREQLRALLERSSARVTESVSGRTDLLFVGTDPGRRKREDAAEHGVPALPERDLYRLLGLEPVDVAELAERPDSEGAENGGEDRG